MGKDQLETIDQMTGYGMISDVPFPSGVGYVEGLCPSL